MMASIDIISDVISTKMLSQRKFLIEKPQIENELCLIKLENPRDIHFHVDKTGENAYVILSDDICNHYCPVKVLNRSKTPLTDLI